MFSLLPSNDGVYAVSNPAYQLSLTPTRSNTEQDFNTEMSLSLEGDQLVIQMDDDYTPL